MAYALPILHVVLTYVFSLLFLRFHDSLVVQGLCFLFPIVMGLVELITVLAVGRKWDRKTLLNASLILKYGLIPFYLVGGETIAMAFIASVFPLPLMIFFGIVVVVLAAFGYGVFVGTIPYAIAYLAKSRKEGIHSKAVCILCGICQFFFVADVISMMILTLKERHLVKTTVAILCIFVLLIVVMAAGLIYLFL